MTKSAILGLVELLAYQTLWLAYHTNDEVEPI